MIIRHGKTENNKLGIFTGATAVVGVGVGVGVVVVVVDAAEVVI